MINQWRTREGDLFMASIVAGILTAGGLMWLFRLHFFLALIVFLIVFVFTFDRTRLYHKTMVKVFAASFADTRQIVHNVLKEKGLPFLPMGSDQYLIEDEVSIKLMPFNKQGFQGTAVSLIPKNHESQQLIFSLRHKLDEAFRPRGL